MSGSAAFDRAGATVRPRHFPLRPIAWCVMLACSDAAWANPAGPAVTAGAANFSTVGKTLTVTNKPGTIIEWRSFSIAAGETTHFDQKSAASAVLNRVVGVNPARGGDPSAILGTLSSNGRVFLINQNGILFGDRAVIDTAGFIASTLKMSDQDFLQGKLRFEGGGNGGVRNEGTIRAGGDILLVGPLVENAGLIRSEAGSVLLAAGKAVTVTSPDAHGVTFTVQAPGDTAVNLGTIEAANAAGMFAGTLRHSGDMQVVNGGVDGAGRILLLAQKDALVQSGSTLSARGTQGGSITVQSGGQTLVSGALDARGAGKGGEIRLLGGEVGVLAGATVDASGGTGGGTVLIGGDYKGANPLIQNALATTIEAGGEVRADGTRQGDGGRVIVWSDGRTGVHGLITARGAGEGARGGFVETSGHYLSVTRPPELSPGGTWLLDPYNLFVTGTTTTTTITPGTVGTTVRPTADDSQIANTDINSRLDAGTNVILDTTGGPGSQPGNITVNAPITKTNTNTASLTFNAQNDLIVNAAINLASGGDINVTTVNAGSSMAVNNVEVRAGGAMTLNIAGALNVSGNGATTSLTAGAAQTINARSILVSGPAAGNVTLSGGTQDITVNNAGAGGGIDVVGTGSGLVAITSGGAQNITLNDAARLRVDGTGAGSAEVSAPSGLQTIVLQGSTSANAIILGSPTSAGSRQLTAASQSITAGQTGQTGSITIRGGVTDTRFAGIRSTGTGNQSVVTTGTISAIAGSSTGGTTGHDALIVHIGTGNQSITAAGVDLQAGSGTDNEAAFRVTQTSGGSQAVTVGAGGITLTGGSGNTGSDADIVQNSTGQAQTITVNGGGAIVLQGGSGTNSNQALIRTAGPTQTINFTAGGDLELTGGTNGTSNRARITTTAAGMQTITGPTGITIIGGASGGGLDSSGNGVGNSAQIRSDVGSQSISVGAGGITLTGGGGAATNNFAEIDQAGNGTVLVPGTTQTVTINNGGAITAQGGSSAQTNVTNGPNQIRGSFAQIQSTGDTQQIDFTAGGAINLTGGTVGSNNSAQIQLRFGANQVITGAPAINITGGASGGTQNGAQNEGNRARIIANTGNQNITAGTITLTGGAGGLNNAAQIVTLATGTSQTLSAPGITMTGGAGGGGFVTGPFSTRGNFAQIRGSGDQTVTVGAGGITMTGGAGPLTDNFANLFQSDTAAGRRQQITVNGGGAITLTGGSSAGVSDPNNSSGSFSFITANGGAGQTIDFGAAGSAITLTGGTVGTGNNVGILARNGPQTITGSPTITLMGGASGGASNNANSATIDAETGLQTITAGATQQTGGSGGTDNFASIRSPNQNITINGNLTLTGSTGGSGRTGARIGSPVDMPTNLALTVNGTFTLNGGSVANSGASLGIGAGATVVQPTNITVNATGDIALNAGTAGVARIGQRTDLLGGGDISLIAGGNITLTGSTAAEASINTTGNVTVRADAAGKSIREVGTNARIRANMLIASAHSGIVMNGNNAVTSLNATNTTANGVQFTQAPGLLLTLMGMPQTGGNVVVSADDMNITAGLTAGTSNVVLRPTTLSRPVNIENTPTANTLSLSPAELNFVTAGRLEVGRLDGTGALSVLSDLANTDINAATLALLSGTDVLIARSFGGFGTEFNNNFEARANNNVTVSNNSLLFANGQTVMLVADNDVSGAGNLAFTNSSGSGKTVLAGTSSGNTANMTLQGVDVTISGANGMNVTLRGSGTQTVTAADEMLVQAGTAAGAQAELRADNGAQNVTARGIAVIGGASGSNNGAQISAGAGQTLTAGAGGITVAAGAGGTGNFARITQQGAASDQAIQINGGGSVNLTGGAGANGSAEILNLGRVQSLTFNAGGAINLQAGSGPNNSNTDIGNFGAGATEQTISFTGGGAINITGGTNGTSNDGGIGAARGNQTITGNPDITLIGGASGGGSTGKNEAFISLDSGSGTQTVNARNIRLTGGAGGTGNGVSIDTNFSGTGSMIANIAATGSVTLEGGAGADAVAGIGSGNGSATITLNSTGPLSLSGGSGAGALAGIGVLGSSSASVSINTQAGVTLTGGSGVGANAQIGSTMGGGNIVVTSGGSIAFVDNGATSGNVRTTGNVTLRADAPGGTISQDANSVIAANNLTASANESISLDGNNQVNRLNVNSGSGGFSFTSSQPVNVDAGTVMTPAGPQLVSITTTGAASDITFTGAVATDDILLFTSARDVVFSGGSSVSATTLSLDGPGTARFPGGAVTLDTPVISNLPVSIAGATVNANGTTVLNNGLALSSGSLQGSGAVLVTAGTFAWSGGALRGAGQLATFGPAEVTGPVSLDGRTWVNFGVANASGASRITLANNAVLFNHPGAIFNLSSTDTTPITGSGSFDNGGTLNNEGTTAHTLTVPLTNSGQINVNAGTLTLGSFPVNAGGVTILAGATLSTNGAALTNDPTGTIMGSGTVNLAGATLTNEGTLAPGASPGTLVIEGNYTQTSDGVLAVEIGGTQQGQTYDFLRVNGTATLAGTLQVIPVNGFTPSGGETFDFLSYRSRSGDFEQFSYPSNVVFQPVPTAVSYGVVANASFTAATKEMVTAVPVNDITVLSENAVGTGSSRESDRSGGTTTATRSSEEEQKKASTQECR